MNKLEMYLNKHYVNMGIDLQDMYKLKHKSFNYYNGLDEQLNSMKGLMYKYKDIEEILVKYSENEYTKRRFIYYMEKGILPEAVKKSQNQAEYSDYHLGMFFLIDQMQEIYKIEEISILVQKLLKISKYIDFGKLLEYYGYILESNTSLNYYIEGMLNTLEKSRDTLGKNINSNEENKGQKNYKTQVDKINSILESSEKKMQGLDEETQREITNAIMDTIVAIWYLANAKYNLSIFEQFAK